MSTPAGMLSRETPWNPSHPAMTSHSIVMRVAIRNVAHRRMGGVDVVQSQRRRPRTRAAGRLTSRIAIRSLTNSCCPYTVMRASAGERAEVDAVVGAAEAQAGCRGAPDPRDASALRRPWRRAGRRSPVRARRRARGAPHTSRVRDSMTIDSMPSRLSRCASISPAGPAPMIATCVRTRRRDLERERAGGRAAR